MDPVKATDLPESMLTDPKIEMPSAGEQTITLTKMEIIDTATDVNMDDADSRHILETEFIRLHRMEELIENSGTDTIPAELLSHHVVDLGSNPEYSQHVVANAQFYENAEFLSTNFTEDDRRLELVTVQFLPPNRADSNSNVNGLSADLLNGKTTLPSVSSLSSDKNVMSAIVSNYAQTVDPSGSQSQSDVSLHRNDPSHVSEQRIIKGTVQPSDQLVKMYPTIYQSEHSKMQILPPLKKLNSVLPSMNGNAQTMIVSSGLSIQQADSSQDTEHTFKTECLDLTELNASASTTVSGTTEEYETSTDQEARSSQKSLPHKKRIPSKLKKAATPVSARNTNVKTYKCTKCGELLPTQAALNSHKLSHAAASKKISFACELCNKTCANQLKFFEHLKSHYEPGMVPTIPNSKLPATLTVVDECEPSEDDQSAKIEMEQAQPEPESENQKNIFTNEPAPFTCDICGRVFRRQKAYECHVSISHPKQEEIEEFSEPEDMMEGLRHVVNMVPTGDEEDKNYDEAWSPPKNIENVVIPQQQPIQKPQYQLQNRASNNVITSAKESSPKKVTRVKQEENTDEEEQAPAKPRKEMDCPHCDRKFVHRNSLLYHIRSHTGHRPHQCEQCGKSFFAAGALKIHHRLHSGDKPYKCEYCGRFFRQWGDLKYHFTSLHSNTKLFQCEYCGKDFARKYSLVVHRRIHTGEKNYICEFCTKTFRAASYLQNHRRIHTGEKPHTCHVCGKPFRVRSDMKRHMKTHPDAANIVNVLADVSNNSADATSTDMCIVSNQDTTTPKQEEQMEVTSMPDQEAEQNIKPDITEAGHSINLNVRPENAAQEGIYNYQREELDRENTGTLYVWIQTGDSILPDA